MEKLFGKHWFTTIVVVVFIVVCIAVLIWTFKESNIAAKLVFNFLNEWAIHLSASITLLLAIAAFWNIREIRISRMQERRRLALERIRFWAEDTLIVLTRPLPKKQFQDVCIELILELHPRDIKCLGILADAELLDTSLHEEVSTTFFSLKKLLTRLGMSLGKEMPDTLKEYLEPEDEMKPFSSESELVSTRSEVSKHLGSLIFSTTKLLVISK